MTLSTRRALAHIKRETGISASGPGFATALSGQRTVQLVASAAASAIVTSTVAAQTQDGRARQTGAAADAGGGWFSDLLAELLQDAQPSQDGTQIPADPSQQTAADASAATGSSPDAWKSIWSAAKASQSSADGQTGQTGAQSATGNQNNWLA